MAVPLQTPADRPASQSSPPTPARESDAAVIHRFFFGLETVIRPFLISLQEVQAPRPAKTVIDRFNSLPERLKAVQPQVQSARQLLVEAQSRELVVFQALHLLQSGFRIRAEAYYLPEATVTAAQQAYVDAQEEEQLLAKKLREVAHELMDRLCGSLGLLWNPQVTADWAEAPALRQQTEALVECLSKLGQISDKVDRLRREGCVLTTLTQHRPSGHGNSEAEKVLRTVAGHAAGIIEQIRQHTALMDHPFPTSTAPSSINDYSTIAGYDPENPLSVAQEAVNRVDKLAHLQEALLAATIRIAEQVEGRAQ